MCRQFTFETCFCDYWTQVVSFFYRQLLSLGLLIMSLWAFSTPGKLNHPVSSTGFFLRRSCKAKQSKCGLVQCNTPLMCYCFPQVSADLRQLVPSARHQHRTATPRIRAGVPRDVPVYFRQISSGTHSSLPTEGGLRLSRPGCLVLVLQSVIQLQRASSTLFAQSRLAGGVMFSTIDNRILNLQTEYFLGISVGKMSSVFMG